VVNILREEQKETASKSIISPISKESKATTLIQKRDIFILTLHLLEAIEQNNKDLIEITRKKIVTAIENIDPDERVFGRLKDQLARGQFNAVSVFRNSPAGNISAENGIGALVEQAAKAGEWVKVELDDVKPEEVEEYIAVNGPQVRRPRNGGVGNLLNSSLATLAANDDKVYAFPRTALAEFVEQRLEQRYGSKAGE